MSDLIEMDGTCQTCRYYDGVRCHRYPPTTQAITGVFIRMNDNDWCGEWEEC